MSTIKAPCGLNLDADTFEVEGQTVKGKGGLPDPSELDDGTMLVVDNGEWTPQLIPNANGGSF